MSNNKNHEFIDMQTQQLADRKSEINRVKELINHYQCYMFNKIISNLDTRINLKIQHYWFKYHNELDYYKCFDINGLTNKLSNISSKLVNNRNLMFDLKSTIGLLGTFVDKGCDYDSVINWFIENGVSDIKDQIKNATKYLNMNELSNNINDTIFEGDGLIKVIHDAYINTIAPLITKFDKEIDHITKALSFIERYNS